MLIKKFIFMIGNRLIYHSQIKCKYLWMHFFCKNSVEVQPSAFNEKKKNKCLFFYIRFREKKWIIRSFWLSYRHNRKNKHVRFHPSSSFSIACYRSLIERFFVVFFFLFFYKFTICALMRYSVVLFFRLQHTIGTVQYIQRFPGIS